MGLDASRSATSLRTLGALWRSHGTSSPVELQDGPSVAADAELRQERRTAVSRRAAPCLRNSHAGLPSIATSSRPRGRRAAWGVVYAAYDPRLRLMIGRSS